MGKPYQRKDHIDKNWYISYVEPSGKRVKKSVGPSKRTAETVLKKIEVEIAEGRYLNLKQNGQIKFVDFLEEFYRLYCVNLKSCPKTHSTYTKQFKEVFKDKYLDEIKIVDIERYKAQRSKEVAEATVNRNLSFLRCLFNKAIAWERFSGPNPVSKVKLFKENNTRLRYLEKEEITRLLSNCNGMLKSIVGLALNTGMRRGEIFNLKWGDIGFTVRTIYIRDSKSGEAREIPMNDEVLGILKGMYKKEQGDYIFCHEDGSRVQDIRKSFWTALRKSDIKDFHFHDLRHTFASQLVMSGVDLNTVRELMGHNSLEMTLRYAHLSPGHKRRAVDILGQNINGLGGVGKKDSVPSQSLEAFGRGLDESTNSQHVNLQTVTSMRL